MTGELVIVTAWKRADFLSACLQRLALEDDGNRHYRLCVDRGFSRDTLAVASAFAEQIGGERARVTARSHRYRGNSYNVLTSYREALEDKVDPDLVHLVEDDVLIGRGYFDYHRRAHDLVPDAFSVSACRNQQYPLDVNPPVEDDAVYAHVSYQSIGVSFRPSTLRQVVAHAKHSYFARPVDYCRRTWPDTVINVNNAEQDGVIHRMIEASGRPTVYPASPRAYHAGFVGYHRKGAGTGDGTIEERAARLLSMTTDDLNAAAWSYPDHQAVDLDAERKPVERVITWP